MTAGRIIGAKYRVDGLLGAGSMGQVYEAVQLGLERSVAIKVLHPGYATDPRFIARFHREALAASKLDHPNSLRILDFGEDDDGLLYIAMELIRGRSLYEVIRAESLSLVRTVDIVSQVLGALAAAHDQGIIHRDIKPENVFLVPGLDDSGQTVERVKVCDFGIAQIQTTAEGAESVTGAGMVCGTPEFMSPEQARGLSLDARSDLYACGILLYELVTGRVPFTADNAVAVALQQVSMRPAPPSLLRADVPRRLEQIILKTLEKEPDDRPQTARELRAQLATSLEGPPVEAGASAWCDEETHPDLIVTSAASIERRDETLPGLAPLPGDAPAPAATVDRSWRRRVSRLVRGHARVGRWTSALALVLVLGGLGLGPGREPMAADAKAEAGRTRTVVSWKTEMVRSASVPDGDQVRPVPDVAELPASLVIVAITGVRSSSALPALFVRRATARLRPALEACYARAAHGVRSDSPTSVWVEIVFARSGSAERVGASWSGTLLPGLSTCVRSTLSRLRTAGRPYAAHARASFAIRFDPRVTERLTAEARSPVADPRRPARP